MIKQQQLATGCIIVLDDSQGESWKVNSGGGRRLRKSRSEGGVLTLGSGGAGAVTLSVKYGGGSN